jgi:hypothetical protein
MGKLPQSLTKKHDSPSHRKNMSRMRRRMKAQMMNMVMGLKESRRIC